MSIKKACLVMLMLGLASCGGESPGLADRGGSTTDPTDPTDPTTTIDSVELLASSPQLQSDGSNNVTLSAIVKDANNQVVEGVEVIFSATSGTLIVANSITSEQGIASAELATGGDPTNRTITVTALSGDLDDTVDVAVIGSSLNIQGPTSLVSGDTGSYTITLSDSGGKGIAGRTINVASSNGNTLSDSAPVTDTNGRVTVTLTGINSGADTLSANALPAPDGTSVTASTTVTVSADSFRFTTPASGTEVSIGSTETVTVRWEKNGVAQAGETIRFAATRGTLTNPGTGATGPAVDAATNASGDATVTITSTTSGNAVITATNDENTSVQRSIEFVATNPTSVSLQADPAVIGVDESSVITAVVTDPSNNRVKNAIVEFTLTDNTGGSLSTASAITDSQGRAQTVYTASSVTSADGGVTVSASVVGGSNPTATTSLTVSGRALFINFGTGNTIEENSTDTHYIKNYVVMVTDSSGAGVANQDVNLSVLSDTYLKGYMVGVDPPVRIVESICQNEDLAPFNGVLDAGEDQNRSEFPEDTNGNGVMDTGEDANGNGFLDPDTGWGKLEPGNRALISPGTVTTDEVGLAEFQLIYPQDHALWLNVTLTAKATVSGTESVRSQRVLLPMSAGDSKNPPNYYSPFGTDFYLQDNCTDEDSGTTFYDPDTL